ncbi:Lon protease C-terminal proteolytic domain-containing protein [Schizophyllum amplum]|uniref:Lon protease C-terminal proteolytic domain-containing protein n=1 Tax=Schizophyllum amplum TaxID=97359 RepID=A0A550CF67_9AGAR|nr:Lon protease C-terminal proteolytic domain-containing protein [Auriculariopsis ampla]
MTAAKLPILPLPHPLVILPAARLSLPISLELGEALLALISESDSLPIVAAVPVTDNESQSLSEYGTCARVLRLMKPTSARNQGEPYLVTLHGLSRVHLPHGPRTSPADLAPHAVDYETGANKVPRSSVVDRFRASALRLLDGLARDAKLHAKKETYAKMASVLDAAPDNKTPWMADLLMGSVNTEYDDRLAMLAIFDVTQRLEHATQVFSKISSISEVTKKISTSIDESLSKQQKEFFLRQQLAAIQRELNALHGNAQHGPDSPVSELDDDENAEADDMSDLKRKIEAMLPGSEERKMGAREWKRLKRIPQGSVENGVVRSYLEWLTALPWAATTAPMEARARIRDRTFLSSARAQLDRDHFGLDNIKKRIIEYLAVVRLRELAAQQAAPPMASPASSSSALVPYNPSASLYGPGSNLYSTGSGVYTPMSPTAGSPKSSAPAKPPRPTQSAKPPILLFVGPPGTGKTSLGQSVARALELPFQRISLGGVRDEAEIRGHRRTYVASAPGLIVQAMRKAGRLDFVLLLDEVDKLGASNFHGDPSAALLEVLDPEQNHSFNDHYLSVPVDLSRILFILTANSLDTMSGPLLDRCEVVRLSGYTYDEKMAISRRYLIPKQIRACALDAPGGGFGGVGEVPSARGEDTELVQGNTGPKDAGMKDADAQLAKTNAAREPVADTPRVVITEAALLTIVTQYTREAGVRSLERAIGAVVRYKAVEWAEYSEAENGGFEEGSTAMTKYEPATTRYEPASAKYEPATAKYAPAIKYNPVVEAHELEHILGIPRYEEEREREARPGVVYGLVVTGQGEGGIMPIESVAVPGTGQLRTTGSLGDVIRESAELALSFVKRHAWELGVTDARGQDPLKAWKDRESGGGAIDVHLHLPAGAQKKDGPSAGTAMTCALVSLLTGAVVPTDVAMTGEITLRGRVTPVGGIKEKVLGAHRAGVRRLVLPCANRKDVEHDVSREIRDAMEFVFVRTVSFCFVVGGLGLVGEFGSVGSLRFCGRVQFRFEFLWAKFCCVVASSFFAFCAYSSSPSGQVVPSSISRWSLHFGSGVRVAVGLVGRCSARVTVGPCFVSAGDGLGSGCTGELEWTRNTDRRSTFRMLTNVSRYADRRSLHFSGSRGARRSVWRGRVWEEQAAVEAEGRGADHGESDVRGGVK